MNEDFTYCVGYGYYNQPDLCKRCARNIKGKKPPTDDVIWFGQVSYIPNKGKCALYVEKNK